MTLLPIGKWSAAIGKTPPGVTARGLLSFAPHLKSWPLPAMSALQVLAPPHLLVLQLTSQAQQSTGILPQQGCSLVTWSASPVKYPALRWLCPAVTPPAALLHMDSPRHMEGSEGSSEAANINEQPPTGEKQQIFTTSRSTTCRYSGD